MRGSTATLWAIVVVTILAVPGGAGLSLGPTVAHASPASWIGSSIPGSTQPRPLGGVLHDLVVTTPALGGPAGSPINFTASLPGVAALSGPVNWTWGDGNTSTDAGASSSHTYAEPGIYEIEAVYTELGTGAVHDNWNDLLGISVWAVPSSGAGILPGTSPQLTGWVVSNGTSSANPTALLPPGGSVTLVGEFAQPIPAAAVDVLYSAFNWSPAIGGSIFISSSSSNSSGESQITLGLSGSAPSGLYPVAYEMTVNVSADNVTDAELGEFVYTLAIGTGLGGGAVPYAHSANPGTFTAYQVGSNFGSLDPSLNYNTLAAQVFRNVYQTLITPAENDTGADAGSFLPVIATCVPGSAACVSLYGSSLLSGDNYTFVIGNSSQFYDPATGASWPVYPSDVEFTIARDLGLSNEPCSVCTTGYLLGQALLPPGNYAWDGGIHGEWNNTPLEVADAITVNGSACPSLATSHAHGCVTFHANGSGSSWPFFEQLISDPFGGSIEPCGWFSAPSQSAGVPEWSQGNVTGAGDEPCPAWGDGMGTAPTSVSPTSWDAWEFDTAYLYAGAINSTAAGSGPYYLSQYSNYTGYTLQGSPSYHANPDCAVPGCPPPSGRYFATVNVVFEATTAPGLAALAAGAADWAQAGVNDSATLAADADTGVATPVAQSQLDYWANEYDFQYNVTLATQLTGVTPTAPSELLADPDLREFLADAFPVATVQSQAFDLNGIQYGVPYGGGAIPLFDGGDTPSNVSWPSGDPGTNPSVVGSAAWWWAQTKTEGLAGGNCTTVSPCTFPVGYPSGTPLVGPAETLWAAEVTSLSGGAIVPEVFAVNFTDYILSTIFSSPGQDPWAVTSAAWLNDYPDPSDSIAPFLSPTGVYGTSSAYPTILQGLNATGCSTSATHWSTLATPVPADCQGAAYNASLDLLSSAATAPLGAGRTAMYAEAEQIEQRLALVNAVVQSNAVAGIASWIQPTSVPQNAWLDTDGVAWYTLALRPGPTVALDVRGPIASPSVVAPHALLSLSALGVGGAGGYTYSWSGLPQGCTGVSAPSFSCSPTQGGTSTVTVTVRDGAGHTATSSVTVEVSGIAIASFTADPSRIALHATTTLTVALAVPSSSVTYNYSNLPSGCLSANTSSLSCTPTAAGTFSITVDVKAPNGTTGSASTGLNVTEVGPEYVFFTATPSALDVGSATDLVINGTNASGAVEVVFGGVPGCGGSVPATVSGTNWRASLVCNPSAVGSYNATGNVTVAGAIVHDSTPMTVNALPTVTLTAARSIDLGQTVALTATVTGGTAPFVWSYTGLPGGCTSANQSTLSCQPTGLGSATITAHLQDADSERASASTSVTVNGALTLVEFVASPDTVSIGGSTNLTVRLGGGSAPFTYTFGGLPTSCPAASTGTLLCIPTTAGTYTVTVTVQDGTGATVKGTATLNVTGGGSSTSAPSTFLGLPFYEGVGLVALLVVVLLAAGVLISLRGSRPPNVDRPSETPSEPEPAPVEQAPAPPDEGSPP